MQWFWDDQQREYRILEKNKTRANRRKQPRKPKSQKQWKIWAQKQKNLGNSTFVLVCFLLRLFWWFFMSGGFLANLLFDCVFIPFVFFNVLLKPTFSVEAGVAIQGQMNHIGFRVYPTISNHTLPRNVSKRGVSKRIWLDFVCTQPYPTMCKVWSYRTKKGILRRGEPVPSLIHTFLASSEHRWVRFWSWNCNKVGLYCYTRVKGLYWVTFLVCVCVFVKPYLTTSDFHIGAFKSFVFFF